MSHGQNAYVVSYGIATPATAMEIVIYISLKQQKQKIVQQKSNYFV